MEFQYLSALCPMRLYISTMLHLYSGLRFPYIYISTKLVNISQGISELLSGQDFYSEILKGQKSVNDVGGVTVPVFCIPSDDD